MGFVGVVPEAAERKVESTVALAPTKPVVNVLLENVFTMTSSATNRN
jgi:hypothetical protein